MPCNGGDVFGKSGDNGGDTGFCFFSIAAASQIKNPASPYGLAGWVRTEIADCAAKSPETGSTIL